MTLREYFPVYVRDYGANNWGDSYYTDVTRTYREYIEPSELADLLLRDIRTSDLDHYYTKLLSTPAVVRKGHKDTGKTVGYSAIEKIHRILSGAFTQAVKWEYIPKNPAANATVPKKEHTPREVWTPQEAAMALNACTDKTLKCCMLIALGCSTRISEILGLQWDCVDLDADTPTIRIGQQLRRCSKDAIEKTNAKERCKVKFIFPEQKQASDCTTVLTLKVPKSRAGMRTLYLPQTVADALRELKSEQDAHKAKFAAIYNDFDMVFAWPNGYPVEGRIIDQRFKALIKSAGLPEVVFHSLRHLSSSMKLELSGGDIKAVQGDTGHSQSKMVTDLYSHTFDANRKRLAGLMETSFFRPEPAQEDGSLNEIVSLLRSNPDMAELFLPVIKKAAGQG